MILGFHHVAMATTDLERMLHFYRDLLGFEIVFESSWKPGSARHDALTALTDSAADFAVLRLGRSYLELFHYSAPTPRPGDPDRPVCDVGITHFCLAVDDIDREYARLKEAGVRFHTEPGPPGPLRATYGRDPDGNVFELIQFGDADHPFAYRGESIPSR